MGNHFGIFVDFLPVLSWWYIFLDVVGNHLEFDRCCPTFNIFHEWEWKKRKNNWNYLGRYFGLSMDILSLLSGWYIHLDVDCHNLEHYWRCYGNKPFYNQKKKMSKTLRFFVLSLIFFFLDFFNRLLISYISTFHQPVLQLLGIEDH